jgi:thioredoxin reductase
LWRHTATVADYEALQGDDFIIIGGYESGVDAAYHLSVYDKKVRLFDSGCPWEDKSSDPSVALSTYSLERMREEWFLQNVELFANTSVVSVAKLGEKYEITTEDGQRFQTDVQPLFAGGFEGSHKMVADLFESREDGFPLLNEHDESTTVSGMFLCGPAVRHGNHIFCFIYKYRQRFAVVAKAIATSLGLPAEQLEMYRQWGMYLDDLSCCGDECAVC